MNSLHHSSVWIDESLPALARQHRVPGAALAVLADGEVIDAATGLLSLATGVEATPDSVFQIGSTTKLWTASLVMQLVDEGLLDLDQPIRQYLPEFRSRTSPRRPPSRPGSCSATRRASRATSSPTRARATTAWRSSC